MNRNRNAIALSGVLAFLTLLMTGWSTPASADTGSTGTSAPLTQQNNGTLWDIRNHWKLRNALGAAFLPTEAGGSDTIQNGQSTGPGTVTHGPGPVQMWPVQIPTATSQVPSQRDQGISQNLMTTFGYPLSDTQFQILGRMNDNIKLEEESDPERAMWNSTAQGAMQSGSAANSAAGMTANQGQSAILFQEKFLVNFTSEAGNRWLVIRDQLFIPIAVLLLLPGAVLCQVKAIIAQGSSVLGDVNPFEGIFRSIIAIFMIPGTLLVINYGIDVSNSVHYTIADEYSRIFGTNMYYDAQCAMWRAFPVNSQNSNTNALRPSNPTTPPIQGNAIQSTYEALDLDVRQYDPCAGLDNSIVPDENQNQNMILARLMTNGTNVGLTGTWNVLCAFQEAFLFYLFCMGPIAAALWVWPVKSLRSALGSWCEGVMILCFWSLFWNTVVLLMACFRGVSETGTVIMTALNFLSTIVTQYAFDFVGLVTSGASAGVQQALNGAAQGAGGAGGGSGGASGGKSAGAAATHGGTGTKAGPQTASSKTNPMSLASASTSKTGPGLPAGAPTTGRTAGLGTSGGPGPGHGGPAAGSAISPTLVPPAAGRSPISTSASGTDRGIPGGPAGPASGDPKHGPPMMNGGPDAKQTGAGGPNLHINGDGSMSVSGMTKGQQLSTADKKHISDQMSQVQKAMENHDSAALAKMAGPDANMKDINNLAQHGSLSTAAQVGMVNGGAGLSTSADGHLVSSTGVPGVSGVGGSQASMGIVGASGISGHGVNIGGPGDGPQVHAKDGFQGTAMGIQSGVDYSGASSSQINQLAKENNLNPNQMSMLTGEHGKAEITGPNGQALGNIQDGKLYAPGAGGSNVMMEQNGQWAAASTGTPLTHEGGAGSSNYQVSGTQIGFDAHSGNFNSAGHSMTASEFAQNTPQGVYAHAPGHEAPAVPGGQMTGLSQAQQAGMQQLGNADGVHNLQTSANGQQVSGVDANGQQHVVANEVGGQWVSAQQAQGGMAGGEVMNSQGQWTQPGVSGGAGGAEHNAQSVPLNQVSGMDSTHQQAFQQLGQADGLSNLQMSGSGHQVTGTDASGHQQVMANEVGGQWVSASQQHGGVAGGEVMNSQGQWTAQSMEHNAPSTPLSQVSGMDSAHQQGFQQLGAADGLQNLQMSGSGQQVTGTDASGHQQVLANEVGGQWVSAQQQHGGAGGGEVMNSQGQFASQGMEHNAPSTPLSQVSGMDAAHQQGFQQLGAADGLQNLQMSGSGQQVTGTDASGHQQVMANEVGGQWVSAQQQNGGVAGGEVMNSQGQFAAQSMEHNAPSTPLSQVSGMDAAHQQGFQQLGAADGLQNLQMSGSGQQVTGTDASGHQQVMANEVGGQWVSAQQQNGGVAGGEVMNSQGQFASQSMEHSYPAGSSGSMAGLDAAQQQSFQQMATSEHLSNASVSANGQQVTGTDASGQQQVMANEVGGQWVSAAQGGMAGGEVMNNQGQWNAPGTSGAGGEHQAQAATPLSQVSGMDSVQQQAFQSLGSAEGYNNLSMSANGQQVLGSDSSGQQHVMATEVGGQWAAAQHNGSADVVMNNQGQWVAPGSSTPLTAHEGAGGSGGTTWTAQGASDVTYNPTTHTMDSGNFHAPAANVTPDMVSNISNNAGVQQLGSEMGASNVHTSYDAQSGMMQAVGSGSDGSNQVVANYNSAEHRWEAAGSNGQVVENSSGNWVANNAGVNGLGSDVQVQANHQGGFDAVGQNGNVVASYDTQAQRWSADNGSVVQDNNHNWVANNQYVNSAQETPVQYNAGGSTTSYDQSSPTYAQTQSSDGGTWSAQAAPELTLNNGTFSTTYGDGGSPAFSQSANTVTPDLVNYVHQNPQQVEGLQSLANHDNLPGSVQFHQGDGGVVQAVADGQAFAQTNGSGWTSDAGAGQQSPQQSPDSGMSALQSLIDNQSSAAMPQAAPDTSGATSSPQYAPESAPPQQYTEKTDGSWATQDSSHSVAHASDGHAMTAQPEPQMPSSPPTSTSHNPNIASAGAGAGIVAAGGAWGALKKQNSMNHPPASPKAPAQQNAPAAPDATAQNKSLSPQESQAREESEKKRREALAKLLKDQGMPGGGGG